jgi:hypothetical protein
MMKPILIAGISIVNLALISYSIAIFSLLKSSVVRKKVLVFLSIGVVFDITATLCMVIGSRQGALTLHGIIGYSSLAGMLIDTIFSYRHAIIKGKDSLIGSSFRTGTRIAYFYWVLAYITGALLIGLRHSS